MTRRGAGFSIVTVAVYLVANQTRIGWLFIVTAFMVGTLILAWVLPRLWVRGMTMSREVRAVSGRTLHEGDQAEVMLTVSKTGVPAYLSLLRDRCPLASPDAADPVFLLPRLTIEPDCIRYTVECYRRGRHAFPAPLVENPGLFGFFRARRVVGEILQVAVYPWYLPDAEWQTAVRAARQQRSVERPGHGPEFLGTREYRPGDPLRRVHWPSTARRDTVIVKEFEEERDAGIAVIIDATADFGEGRDTTLEYSVKLAASVARYAGVAGRPFRVLSWPPSPRQAAWTGTLEYLTGLQVSPDAPTLSAFLTRVTPGEVAVVISPFLHEHREALHQVTRRGIPLLDVGFVGFTPAQSAASVTWQRGADPRYVIPRIIEALEARLIS